MMEMAVVVTGTQKDVQLSEFYFHVKSVVDCQNVFLWRYGTV